MASALKNLTFVPCENEHEEAWEKGQGVAPVIRRIHLCVAARCGDNIWCIHHVMFGKDDIWGKLKEWEIKKSIITQYRNWAEIGSLLDDLKRIRIKGDMRWDNGATYITRNPEWNFINQDVRELNAIVGALKEDSRFTKDFIDILISLISAALLLIENREGEIRKTQEALFDEKFLQAKFYYNEAMTEIMAEIRKAREK